MKQNSKINNFDKIASNYITNAIIQKKIAKILFKNYEFIGSNNKKIILDLGSGPGTFLHSDNFTYDALLNNFDIINFDICFNMLINNNNKRVFKINADINHMPILNNSIDIIISNLAIQWFDKKKKIFNNLQKILKKNGSIIISTLIKDSFCELDSAYKEINIKRKSLCLDDCYQYELYCKENNLKVQKKIVWEEVLYFENILDLFLHFKSNGTKITQSNSLGLYGKKLISNLEDVYKKSNNLFPLTYKCLLLFLTHE